LVYDVVLAEEFAARRIGVTASITPGSRSKSTARGTYFSSEAFMVKHVYASELRIVVAAVLAAAADTVLVAHHLLKLDLRACELSRTKKKLIGGSTSLRQNHAW
jgi:hypothetical protein